jgi:hypothetical protein
MHPGARVKIIPDQESPIPDRVGGIYSYGNENFLGKNEGLSPLWHIIERNGGGRRKFCNRNTAIFIIFYNNMVIARGQRSGFCDRRRTMIPAVIDQLVLVHPEP